ncbi:hypothetical protein SSPO_048930 [Streptomyces antimycoticus]|uniref:Uncharacterized protein n=1 Tax=Streptomyces antimycoticus TaxID=68175 RepID=A0A499UJV3_9ACTN|nr:hypothetical protein SSPO_048930 [Streptomyces antimycoticus]
MVLRQAIGRGWRWCAEFFEDQRPFIRAVVTRVGVEGRGLVGDLQGAAFVGQGIRALTVSCRVSFFPVAVRIA